MNNHIIEKSLYFLEKIAMIFNKLSVGSHLTRISIVVFSKHFTNFHLTFIFYFKFFFCNTYFCYDIYEQSKRIDKSGKIPSLLLTRSNIKKQLL